MERTRVTVQDCIDFYKTHNDLCTKQAKERLLGHLGRLLGRRTVCTLRRGDIWEALHPNLPWPTCRDCLVQLKTVLNYAAKPRLSVWAAKGQTPPAPLISKWDNPLLDVTVNVTDHLGCKMIKPTPELRHDMLNDSEAAFRKAQMMRLADEYAAREAGQKRAREDAELEGYRRHHSPPGLSFTERPRPEEFWKQPRKDNQ